jgi:hypothetical protein
MARRNSTGVLALLVLGGVYLYRNRYKIQQFLESQGVKTPLDTSSAGSAISSGASKISGAVQNAMKGDALNRTDRKIG